MPILGPLWKNTSEESPLECRILKLAFKHFDIAMNTEQELVLKPVVVKLAPSLLPLLHHLLLLPASPCAINARNACTTSSMSTRPPGAESTFSNFPTALWSSPP